MELVIRPDDLAAAALALTRCGEQLDDAGLTFARRAQSELPDVGAKAAEATARAIVITERALQTVSTDIDRLAHALAALARHYHQVDDIAVSRR